MEHNCALNPIVLRIDNKSSISCVDLRLQSDKNGFQNWLDVRTIQNSKNAGQIEDNQYTSQERLTSRPAFAIVLAKDAQVLAKHIISRASFRAYRFNA